MAKRPTKPKPAPVKVPSELGPMAITVSEAATSNIARLYNPTDYASVALGLMGTIYSASNFKAKAFSGVPLRLYRVKRGGAKVRELGKRRKAFFRGDLEQRPSLKALTYGADQELEEVTDHPALALLQDPEPGCTGTQWFWLLHMMRQLTGRNFLWDGGDYVPKALYALRNPFVTIKYSRTELVAGYWYGRDSTSKEFLPANEVLYLRSNPSLSSHVDASPWPTSISGLAQLEANAIQSEVSRWNNAGQPGMVFEATTPFTDKAQLREAKQGLNEQVRSVAKHGDTMILSALKLVQYAAKPHEMNYEVGLTISEKRIYRAAGIPEGLWMMAAANKASAVAADPAFASMTVLPELGILADEFTELLLPRYGVMPGELWFAFDNPVREDAVQASATAVSMYTAGLIRRGAALAMAGLELENEADDVYAGQSGMAGAGGAPGNGVASGEDVASQSMGMASAGPDTDKLQALLERAASGGLPVASARLLAEMMAPGTDVAGLFAPLEKKDEATVDVQDTALNGAQIAELTSLVAQVAAGEIPLESARAVADAAYPLVPPEKIDAVFNPLRTFKPREQENGGNEMAGPGGPGDGGGGETVPPGEGEDGSGESGVDDGEDGGGDGEGGEDDANTKAVCSCSHARVKATPEEERVIDELKQVLKRVLGEQMGGATFGADGTVSLPDTTDTQAFARISEAVANVYKMGADAMAEGKGETPTITPVEAIEYSAEHTGKMVKEITETTRERLQVAVTTGLEEGKNVQQIQAEIAEKVPEVSESRAENIARTETARAMQNGENAQAVELGYDVKHWLLAGGPCPLCEAAEQAKASGVPVDEPFFKAGETITGTDGKPYTFTMDVMVPSDAHPSCRCAQTHSKGGG